MEDKKESGLLSLEACIAVTIFIFLMLFMYSFFVVFEARNAIGHAVLAATDSLALDAYDNSINRDRRTDSMQILKSIFSGVYGSSGESGNDFIDERLWYEAEESGGAKGYFQDVIQRRFLAYLTAGESDRADEILQSYHIQNGVAGLDFSESKVEDDKLYLSVKYTIEYEFQVFNLDVLKMEQKACSKLWKAQ